MFRYCRQLIRAATLVGSVSLLVAAIAVAMLLPASQALATCNTFDNNQTCTNSTSISGGTNGITDTGTLTLTNTRTGIIAGDDVTNASGIKANTANVTNFGTIVGLGPNSIGIQTVFGNATVVNSGSISGTFTGIYVPAGSLNLTNSGTISGGSNGIFAFSGSMVNNTGTITGVTGINAGGAGGGWTLTNSGNITGTGGTAIDFSASTGDTLNFLAGSRIVGDISLGVSDNINIRTGRDIGWLLTFGACGGCGGIINSGSTVNVTGGSPYVVSGDQIAVLDPTAFGLADRMLIDFTGNVSSLIGARFGEFASAGVAQPEALAYAPATSSIASGANAAFASETAIANAQAAGTSARASVPNATAVDHASGIAVWSKGFAGVRKQEESDPMLAATIISYGGAIGMDRQVSSDLRAGLFFGVGNSRMDVDANSQTIKSDMVFGGLYGRFDFASNFFDFVVSGGHSTNNSSRSVANNLVATGLETATASYNGWYISPELAYGVRMPLGSSIMLTPTARVRYVAGFLGGYSEIGSAQNLSVDSRTTQNLEERFDLVLSHAETLPDSVLKTTATLGVLGLERLGSTTINAVLIGQNLSFATPGKDNAAGVHAGVGFDYRVSPRVSLFAAADGMQLTDKSRSAIATGGARVTF